MSTEWWIQCTLFYRTPNLQQEVYKNKYITSNEKTLSAHNKYTNYGDVLGYS